MGQEEDPLEMGPISRCPHPFKPKSLAVQRKHWSEASGREVPSRGYHFWAVYTKVSRLYPKSQVTCPNI